MVKEAKSRRTRSDQGGLLKLRKKTNNHELLDPGVEYTSKDETDMDINSFSNSEVSAATRFSHTIIFSSF